MLHQMRKIESQMNAAIKARRNWSSGNTSVNFDEQNVAYVYLHGNKIAVVSDKFLKLYDGGWQSNTTKSRLNALLDEFHYGFKVFQRQFNWFVGLHQGQTPFYSGIRLNHGVDYVGDPSDYEYQE